MAKMIFVNLPVKDVAKATAFYEAIGCVKNEQFSNEKGSALIYAEGIHFMLLAHDLYSTFTPKPIGDAHTNSAALYALSFDSKTEVDAIVTKAVAAGAREPHGPEDQGFMYSRAFEDLDGNSFGPFWMDVSAMPAA